MGSSRAFRRHGELGSQQPAPPSQIHSKEKQRSRTGCHTCRSRKVKCDERPGGCLNCARLNLSCPKGAEYIQTSGSVESSSQTQAGLRRLRTYRSCKDCRNSKTRCSGERPICRRCRQRKNECVYDGKQVPAWLETATSSETHGPRTMSSSSEQGDGLNALTPASTAAERHEPSQPMSSIYGEGVDPTVSGKPGQEYGPQVLSWLLSSQLPEREKIVLLVKEFFSNFHNLRCFGFIHKPSYMQQIDDQSRVAQQENPLLHTLCALGAKFYALRCSDQMTLPENFALRVGNQWASRAKAILFTNMNSVSIQNTMAVVLLHEHDLRIGNYASAFMLTGFSIRMAQALQINLERSTGILRSSSDELPSWSCRESRRRLMWSIYTMDSWVGSGVDELTLINERDIKIQLPCNERNFSLKIPCLVETLQQGEYLPFLSVEDRAKGPVDTLDLQAHFIRLLSIRRKVLRYVKHLNVALPPWLPDSEFSRLETSLFSWYEGLPNSLHMSRTAIYMRKESSQLGGLMMLHWTYQQTLCDLNRIAMQELFQIRHPIVFPPEQVDFQKQVQDRCFEHATAIALVFKEALRHGSEVFADTWLPVIAHDSTRVIVYYVTGQLGTFKDRQVFIKPHALNSAETNITALKKMVPMFQLAKPLYEAASIMLRKAGFELAGLAKLQFPVHGLIAQDADMPATAEPPPQFTPEYLLNPLAIYRMARRDIQDQEKHAPERRTSTIACLSNMAMATAPLDSQPAPLGHTNHIQPDNPGLWLESGSSGAISFEDNFQLPSSFDDLQAYLPLMYNNFSLPIPEPFGELGPSGNASDYSGASTSVYPPPDAAMTNLSLGPGLHECASMNGVPRWE